MQMPGAGGPDRRKRPGGVIGGGVEIEGIALAGLARAPGHESERGGLCVAGDEAEVDPRRGERAGERLAIGVARDARDEGRGRAEPGEADRDVERRAAERGVVAARLRRDRE